MILQPCKYSRTRVWGFGCRIELLCKIDKKDIISKLSFSLYNKSTGQAPTPCFRPSGRGLFATLGALDCKYSGGFLSVSSGVRAQPSTLRGRRQYKVLDK